MAPTIRIDEEVYSWLQSNAKPFEDTPNSVLRRLAGIEVSMTHSVKNNMADTTAHQINNGSKNNKRSPTSKSGRMGLTGKQLNKEWQVGAHHALFSKEGSWYENLETFPGAFFDPRGYVLFKTEEEYRKNPYIKVGKKTNVPKGIASMPNYVIKA